MEPIKKAVEDNLADSIKGKVEFFTTVYRKPNSGTGRGWITIEGVEIVNFSTMASGTIYGSIYNETTPDNKRRYLTHKRVLPEDRSDGNLVEKGEFSRPDLNICMFESLNTTVKEMLEHESPIVQSLGILDKRTGVRTLEKLKELKFDALPQYMLEYRLRCEKRTAYNISYPPAGSTTKE